MIGGSEGRCWLLWDNQTSYDKTDDGIELRERRRSNYTVDGFANCS